MDRQQITTEMIEFNKAVERLWATYDSCQKRFYEDNPLNAGPSDFNRYNYKATWGQDNKLLIPEGGKSSI